MEGYPIEKYTIKNKSSTARTLWVKVALLVVIVIVMVFINVKILNISPVGFSEWLGNFPILAPAIFLGLYFVRPLFLFPITIFYITGGLAFGPIESTIYAAVGGGIGAVIIYLLARFFDLEELLHKIFGNRIEKVQTQLDENGFLYIFLLRNVPIANYDLVSYLAGMSKTPFKKYVLGSALGNVPIAYLYGYIGFTFSQGEYEQGILITIVVLVAVVIVSIYMKKNKSSKIHIKKHERKNMKEKT